VTASQPRLDISLEMSLALLDQAQRERVLEDLDPAALLFNWDYTGRPSQLDATRSKDPVVLFSAGRGAGKTRSGAEWVRDGAATGPPIRVALVGRTIADVRDVMIQGDSGLLSVFPFDARPRYIPTLRRVEFANGSIGLCFTSIEPDQLRGPQFHKSWGDEMAAWSFAPDENGLTAWDNLRIATRLGAHPQIFVTTTPKRVPAVLDLYQQARAGDGVSLHSASTFDNPHLSEDYLRVLRGLYEGTRLGAQELYAQLLEVVEGALWSLDAINDDRLVALPERPPLRVVGVDPSVSDAPGDECGIVVVGATRETNPIDRTAYVLADYSLLGPPADWARAVVRAARDWEAPVVAESNQGGALVREMIHSIDSKVRVRLVTAKVGKTLRAEPVTLAYDRHRVRHVGYHAMLEDQLTTWVPGETKDSPDRLDALVHGLTALVVPSAVRSGVGSTRVSRPGSRVHFQTGAQAVVSSGRR
jgi:phage terminase large subunit-like protein